MKPNTLTELLEQATEALENNDEESLMRLQEVNNGWLQTEEERRAVDNLLEVAMEKIGQI